MKGEAWDSHPGWADLPAGLRAELEEGGETKDPENARYDPALLLTLEFGFTGVLNSYLAERLREQGVPCSGVTGEIEPLLACPCCGYLTLEERGGYSICPVCFWEDDGVDEPSALSGPNHMTLGEGQKSFARLGAVTQRERRFVDPEGPRKYPRSTKAT